MQYLNKLPGYYKSATGYEWVLFKKLPLIFMLGTAPPCATMLYLFLTNDHLSAEQLKTMYVCLGFIFSHWFFVGILFFGCILVMLMKGPTYVADPYQLPIENKKFEQYPNL